MLAALLRVGTVQGLLIYLAGILSTVVGSWVASKIRIYHDERRLHHEDLKSKVLIPLREGLRLQYDPLVSHRSEVVRLQTGQLRRIDHAKVTENAEIYGPCIQAMDPAGSVQAALDVALLEDARQKHYRELIAAWEAFKTDWTNYARKFEEWVLAMAVRILNGSQLPPHPAYQVGPYVMESSLAIFLYLRLFGRQSSNLGKISQGKECFLLGVGTVASGSDEQIDRLVALLDGMIESERGMADTLRIRSAELQVKLKSLSQKLSLAVAERGLRRRCSMVTFFR